MWLKALLAERTWGIRERRMTRPRSRSSGSSRWPSAGRAKLGSSHGGEQTWLSRLLRRRPDLLLPEKPGRSVKLLA